MYNYEVRLATWKKNGGEAVFNFEGLTPFIEYAKVRVAIEKALTIKYDNEKNTIYMEE